MAVQFTPLAAWALKYGAAAAVGFAAARFLPRGRLAPAVEAEMDRAPRGLRLRRAPGQIAGSVRAIKSMRLGRISPKLQLDGTALMRLRVRRVS